MHWMTVRAIPPRPCLTVDAASGVAVSGAVAEAAGGAPLVETS
jgi:hypothetical protein